MEIDNQEWLKEILTRIEKPSNVEQGVRIELPNKIRKRSPIHTFDGKPPHKKSGPITGRCSACEKKATRRFRGTAFCNVCYRKDLERRYSELSKGGEAMNVRHNSGN